MTAAGLSLPALGYSFGKVPGKRGAGFKVAAAFRRACHPRLLDIDPHHIRAALDAPFYGDDERREGLQDRGGMQFPGADEPDDYWDLLYFSFVIGMTCQVSDVAVTSRSARRMVLRYGVLSFFFNTFILVLAVNFVAGSLG